MKATMPTRLSARSPTNRIPEPSVSWQSILLDDVVVLNWSPGRGAMEHLDNAVDRV